MNKEIDKTRREVIRYLIATDHIPQERMTDCAKCRVLVSLGVDQPNAFIDFAGRRSSLPDIIAERLGMSVGDWHQMEENYEGYHLATPGFKPKSFKSIAYWLQLLPGWPKVL